MTAALLAEPVRSPGVPAQQKWLLTCFRGWSSAG